MVKIVDNYDHHKWDDFTLKFLMICCKLEY
jgi:hypothetical protein